MLSLSLSLNMYKSLAVDLSADLDAVDATAWRCGLVCAEGGWW